MLSNMSPAATAPILTVEQLAFSWRDKPVLRDICLRLAPGTILALLGPNGAGKSTLIRCICGRLRPDGGRIEVAGGQPLSSAAARTAIGLVPQQIALYPHLSVRENLQVFARLAGLGPSQARAAIEATIEACDLLEVVDRAAGKLSGGWQRRVNIASALSHAPRLLILDEPTVGIDPPAREAIEHLLRRLAEGGLAILMTSHDLPQLESMAHQVAFLADGRVVAQGAPPALIDEFFGTARDCQVMLARQAGRAAADRLQALGLAAVGSQGLHWSGLLEAAAASQLQTELSGDPAVLEFRARRPGLPTLWAHLYGREPEPLS